jgi:predicted phosphodiesterase
MLRIIGDVHGHHRQYKELIKDADYSIQIGDMGFKDTYFHIHSVNPLSHVFIPGNHDDYDHLPTQALGNYGHRHLGDPSKGLFEFFFIRGALSVDKKYRTEGVSWWREEELNTEQMNKAYTAWVRRMPQLVISHDCPHSIMQMFMANDWKMLPSSTGKLLEALYAQRPPKLWIFGHHHNTKAIMKDDTLFVCLDELDHIDIADHTADVNTIRDEIIKQIPLSTSIIH